MVFLKVIGFSKVSLESTTVIYDLYFLAKCWWKPTVIGSSYTHGKLLKYIVCNIHIISPTPHCLLYLYTTLHALDIFFACSWSELCLAQFWEMRCSTSPSSCLFAWTYRMDSAVVLSTMTRSFLTEEKTTLSTRLSLFRIMSR